MKNIINNLTKLTTAMIALAIVTAIVLDTNAASYARTSLRQMTQSAAAVAEVTVLNRTYPAINGNAFPRTHVEVTVTKTLKGSLPTTITLDLPGAVHGNVVYSVPDSANFEINEKAMVFLTQGNDGRFLVQDLGLGKFNLVDRNGATFVESPLCPKAIQNNDLETSFLTKSIPYADFCKLVSAYAQNEEPAVSPLKMAALNHTCNNATCAQTALKADALKNVSEIAQTNNTLNVVLAFVFLCVCAAVVVMIRRNALKIASAKSVTLVLVACLTAGALFGGAFSSAYVAAGSTWDLDNTTIPAKIHNGKIVFKTAAASKTNANSFDGVLASMDKWSTVQNCRLGFENAGTCTNTINSANDGVNFIAWNTNPGSDFGASTLAVTYTVYTVGGKQVYIDGDMIFNDRDFSWGAGQNGNARSVSLHELGHFIGLNHTTSASTVMYPYDGGLTSLSSDEINAAQTLYPGVNTTPLTTPAPATAPTAAVTGSPLSGPAPLNAFLDASTTVQGSDAIATYSWNFGDGSNGAGKTTNHTFTTPGSFNVVLTVTDVKGLSSTANITVNVSNGSTSQPTQPVQNNTQNVPASGDNNGQLLRGSFKLVFITTGRDTFSGIFFSQNAGAFAQKARLATGRSEGTVMIGDAKFNFSFDGLTLKGYGDGGMKLQMSSKTGLISVTMKSADLQSALANYGAANDNTFGTVNAPVSIVFGNGADLTINTTAQFAYKAIADKCATGKY